MAIAKSNKPTAMSHHWKTGMASMSTAEEAPLMKSPSRVSRILFICPAYSLNRQDVPIDPLLGPRGTVELIRLPG
jgi:hypothetical protein